MLYGNQSISTYTPSNAAVWMAMAFQGGTINIGAYMACHNFASHVTGFATLFGFEIARSEYSRAFGFLIVPALFFFGAMASGFLVDLRLKLEKRPKYFIVFGILFLLNLLVVIGGFNGLFGPFGKPVSPLHDYTLLALLCFICGLQNGTITSVSRAVVRTTHLTGVLTDLGIGVVRVIHRKKIVSGVENEVKANFMRLGLISFFILGSMTGGLIFFNSGFRGFLLPTFISGALFVVTFYFQVLKAERVA